MTAPDVTTVDPDLVEVVARALAQLTADDGEPNAWDRPSLIAALVPIWRRKLLADAISVLAALAEHGALMPTGGETVVEAEVIYRVVRGLNFGSLEIKTYKGWTPERRATEFAAARSLSAEPTSERVRTVTTWPDGHTLAGHTLISPWRSTDG